MTWREQCHRARGKCLPEEDRASNEHFQGYFWNSGHIESRYPIFEPWGSIKDGRGARRSKLSQNYAALHDLFVSRKTEVAPRLLFLH